MWETERDGVSVDPDSWSDPARSAHEEWARRLEMAEHEYGSGASRGKARRYEAYCDGRADELKVSGEDLRIARTLFDAIEYAQSMVGRAVPGGPSDTLATALRSLSAADLIRLRARD